MKTLKLIKPSISNDSTNKNNKNGKSTSKTTTIPIQKKEQAKARTKKQTVFQKNRRVPRMIVGAVSFLIGIAGFLFLVYPRISVYPGISLDLRNPFQTPFMIKNDGYLPLYNIKYSLIAERMELVNGTTFINSGGSINNTVDKLSPNKSSALFMNRIFAMPPNFVKYARVFIHVTYRPFLMPFTFTEHIRFKTEINANGEYVWFEFYDKQ
jgi:hypothetical protein